MNVQVFFDVLKDSLEVCVFVTVMMTLIEALNVESRGNLSKSKAQSGRAGGNRRIIGHHRDARGDLP